MKSLVPASTDTLHASASSDAPIVAIPDGERSTVAAVIPAVAATPPPEAARARPKLTRERVLTMAWLVLLSDLITRLDPHAGRAYAIEAWLFTILTFVGVIVLARNDRRRARAQAAQPSSHR